MEASWLFVEYRCYLGHVVGREYVWLLLCGSPLSYWIAVRCMHPILECNRRLVIQLFWNRFPRVLWGKGVAFSSKLQSFSCNSCIIYRCEVTRTIYCQFPSLSSRLSLQNQFYFPHIGVLEGGRIRDFVDRSIASLLPLWIESLFLCDHM